MESGKGIHLLNMKYHFLFIFLVCSLSLFGQDPYDQIFEDSIKEINWSCSIIYLPSPQSEYTTLNATPHKVKAVHTFYKFHKRYKRKQRHHLNISKSEFAEMVQRYNALRQPFVDFAISDADKDSLRAFLKEKTYKGTPRYKISPEQLEKYLENDTIRVDMKVFAMDSVNNLLGLRVIDGAPFRFQMMTISKDNDTTVHHYDGNLFGGDRYRELPDYLLFNTLNAEFDLYKYLPLDEYFSRSNFLRTILRYLEGKEGLLEFKPLRLILEEE